MKAFWCWKISSISAFTEPWMVLQIFLNIVKNIFQHRETLYTLSIKIFRIYGHFLKSEKRKKNSALVHLCSQHWRNVCILYTNKNSTHYTYFCHKKLNSYIILTDHFFFFLAVTGCFLSTFAVSEPRVQWGTAGCVWCTHSPTVLLHQNLSALRADRQLCIAGWHVLLSVLL